MGNHMIEQHHEPGSIVWTERNNATDLYATWALVSPINATRLHLQHRVGHNLETAPAPTQWAIT